MSIALRKLNTSSGMMFNSCFATDSEPGVVAVLRSYPSMAEQALQQRQIPFDIIFDQQLDHLGKYDVVVTDNTGIYDGWRRLREEKLHEEMLSKLNQHGKGIILLLLITGKFESKRFIR